MVKNLPVLHESRKNWLLAILRRSHIVSSHSQHCLYCSLGRHSVLFLFNYVPTQQMYVLDSYTQPISQALGVMLGWQVTTLLITFDERKFDLFSITFYMFKISFVDKQFEILH